MNKWGGYAYAELVKTKVGMKITVVNGFLHILQTFLINVINISRTQHTIVDTKVIYLTVKIFVPLVIAYQEGISRGTHRRSFGLADELPFYIELYNIA